MIIHNFDFVGVVFSPNKAYSPLIIYPDTVLSFALPMKRFQSIARWNP